MTMQLNTVDEMDVRGKRVLLRADFNVPLDEGRITDDNRVRATLPTIRALLDKQATLVVMSHLGRPKGVDDRYRLEPVAVRLEELLGREVRYRRSAGPASPEEQSFVHEAPAGSVTLVENLRFDARETKNEPSLARELATYGDLYVDDAFGAVHRAHASTVGVARLLPSAAGLLLQREVEVLSRLLEQPAKPFKVILGGAKVSDKIGVIDNLLEVVDEIFVGGAMAYTFLAAQGGSVGASLVEEDHLATARDVLEVARTRNTRLHLPQDSLCAKEIREGAPAEIFPSDDIPDGYMGLDIGPSAIAAYQEALADAKTIFWNGPLGVFETPPFDSGTRIIAETVASLPGAFTVVGGGDSVSAIRQTGMASKIDHISTGGGASLEFLEGKTLPGLEVLQQ
ncbi:MAG TPA: phosphoglycerate kinase [Trueperaceae bacterium]